MLRRIATNGIHANVAVTGAGPAVLLLHGFPHTWQVGHEVIGPVSARHRAIAPDLRGLGTSTRAEDGYDAGTLAADAEGILDALGEDAAAVVAIDAGTPAAVLLAALRPERVRRLVVMESLLGGLPGAESFLAGGPPWWFGFHAVPGLAETVLTGHEAEYIDWFLAAGTRARAIPPEIRDAFVAAYTGHDALRVLLLPRHADQRRQVTEAVVNSRLTMPTMAIGSHPVGRTLEHQLRPITDDLVGHHLPDCGHIIPLDRPQELLRLLDPFLAGP